MLIHGNPSLQTCDNPLKYNSIQSFNHVHTIVKLEISILHNNRIQNCRVKRYHI